MIIGLIEEDATKIVVIGIDEDSINYLEYEAGESFDLNELIPDHYLVITIGRSWHVEQIAVGGTFSIAMSMEDFDTLRRHDGYFEMNLPFPDTMIRIVPVSDEKEFADKLDSVKETQPAPYDSGSPTDRFHPSNN